MNDAEKATARLLEVMDTLRRECPWDREQTFDSLRNNTIEEVYELADAITDKNMEGIKEELGDLLLHVAFYSKLGDEQGAFDYTDVANGVCDKLIYRHPHVYGDIHADTPEPQEFFLLNLLIIRPDHGIADIPLIQPEEAVLQRTVFRHFHIQ